MYSFSEIQKMVLRKPHNQKKIYDMLSSLLRKSFLGFKSHVNSLGKELYETENQ